MLGRARTKPPPPPTPRRPDPTRQCTSTTRAGLRCGQWTTAAPRGSKHCHHHIPPTPLAGLTAAVAVVDMAGSSWKNWKFGTREWQDEGWRLYDLIGQLHFVANWVGNSVSRCRLYVAEVDESGEPGEEATDQQIAQLASGPLGSGPAKDEALRLLGVNGFVPGECYIIAEADAGPDGGDRWFVVPGRQVRRVGAEIRIHRSQLHGGGDMVYREGVDLILRVHTPHPADPDEPDSPTRAALTDLLEIEALRKREYAELDSRLAGAGMLPLPEGIDFPRGDKDPPGVEGFMQLLMRTMATSLSDRASAEAVAPIMFTVPGEYVDKIKLVSFATDLSEQILPLREAAVRSLAQSLDIPPEVLLGIGETTNHWCTVRDVEVMSSTGWKTYDQLTPGEDVLTLNHETGLSEWQPLLAVNTWDVVDEPMVAINGRGHSSLTTPHHRWPTLSGRGNQRQRAWDTTGDLLSRAQNAPSPDTQLEDYILLAAPHADLPAEAKYSDALVELVAWYFTEGSLGIRTGRRTPTVTIYQSHHINPDNCARIRRALATLFGPVSETLDKGGRYATAESVERRAEARRLRVEDPHITALEIGRRLGVSGTMAGKYLQQDSRLREATPRWRETSRADGRMTCFVLNAAAAEVILEHAPRRVVSLDFVRALTAAQLELFIDTAVRGDGHVQTGGTRMFGQKDPRMCDAFELAAILAGRYVNRQSVTGMGLSADGPRERTQHLVSVGSRTTFSPRGRNFTEQPYTGTIWCPTTPNGTWLARHEGTVFYTGNSAWAISEEAITTQIVPVLARIAEALTTGYLRRALEQLGEDPTRWVYAFDTAALTTRPNRAVDAINYHGAGLLSDQAAVEVGAFRKDQLPSVEERLRRSVEKVFVANPAVVLADPDLRRIIGIAGPPTPAPQLIGGPAGEPAPAPEPEKNPNSPPEQKPQTEQMAALVTVSNLVMRRALAKAGSRLVPHTQRDRYPATPRYQLHCHRGAVSRDMADKVLRDAWEDVPEVAADLHLDARQLQSLLHGFAAELLTRGMAYDVRLLRDLIAAAGRGQRLNTLAGVGA